MSGKHLMYGNKTYSKQFSIDDAFEEETDEILNISGLSNPKGLINNEWKHNGNSNSRSIQLKSESTGGCKLDPDGSRDSDSLIQDCYDSASQDFVHYSCFKHPKVQENWKMVLAAITLLFIGLGLLTTGILAFAEPQSGLQGTVFILTGFICFVPGAYHVVYIYLAAKGKRGYHFHNLPLFT